VTHIVYTLFIFIGDTSVYYRQREIIAGPALPDIVYDEWSVIKSNILVAVSYDMHIYDALSKPFGMFTWHFLLLYT
jgi:hypothetical protein